MRRRAAAGEAGHRQVEAAPEEVHRAGLADEAARGSALNTRSACTSARQKRCAAVGVVGAVRVVGLERRSGSSTSHGTASIGVGDAQRGQGGHDLAVEVARR